MFCLVLSPSLVTRSLLLQRVTSPDCLITSEIADCMYICISISILTGIGNFILFQESESNNQGGLQGKKPIQKWVGMEGCSRLEVISAAAHNKVSQSTSSGRALGPALNTNLKPRARQGSANDPQSIAARVLTQTTLLHVFSYFIFQFLSGRCLRFVLWFVQMSQIYPENWMSFTG